MSILRGQSNWKFSLLPEGVGEMSRRTQPLVFAPR
jgi:hypothetical protein